VRPRAAALAVAAWLLLGGGFAPSAAEPAATPARIGRYELARRGDVLDVRAPRELRLGAVLAGSGLLLAALALFTGTAGRKGVATGMAVLGIGLAAVGGSALLGSTRWQAGPRELVRERSGGRVDRWRREEIADIEVRRRSRSARDLKETRLRPFEVRPRRPGGSPLPTRFTLESEADARALARELASALGVEVHEN
jgi:hypothetical protein